MIIGFFVLLLIQSEAKRPHSKNGSDKMLTLIYDIYQGERKKDDKKDIRHIPLSEVDKFYQYMRNEAKLQASRTMRKDATIRENEFIKQAVLSSLFSNKYPKLANINHINKLKRLSRLNRASHLGAKRKMKKIM